MTSLYLSFSSFLSNSEASVPSKLPPESRNSSSSSAYWASSLFSLFSVSPSSTSDSGTLVSSRLPPKARRSPSLSSLRLYSSLSTPMSPRSPGDIMGLSPPFIAVKLSGIPFPPYSGSLCVRYLVTKPLPSSWSPPKDSLTPSSPRRFLIVYWLDPSGFSFTS